MLRDLSALSAGYMGHDGPNFRPYRKRRPSHKKEERDETPSMEPEPEPSLAGHCVHRLVHEVWWGDGAVGGGPYVDGYVEAAERGGDQRARPRVVGLAGDAEPAGDLGG